MTKTFLNLFLLPIVGASIMTAYAISINDFGLGVTSFILVLIGVFFRVLGKILYETK